MNTDSILVTGGAGFIGSHTCDRLLETEQRGMPDNFTTAIVPGQKEQHQRR